MTKRIPKPATPSSLLASLVQLVTTPGVSDADKTQAISIAYELGKGEGRVLGAESMGNTIMATFNKAAAVRS
jgi:hypothetical protein